jgi:hypothetical protein
MQNRSFDFRIIARLVWRVLEHESTIANGEPKRWMTKLSDVSEAIPTSKWHGLTLSERQPATFLSPLKANPK